MMRWLIVVLIVLAVAYLLIKRRRNAAGATAENPDFPYILADSLFSAAERSFLGALEQALGKQYRILGKVRVCDVINIRKGTENSRRQRAFNRISAKHFDFLLCRPDDLKPLCAIELNDKSHQREQRQERDQFLEQVCRTANLPLLFIPAQHAYVLDEIRRAVETALGGQSESIPLIGADNSVAAEAADESSKTDEIPASPNCPRCGNPMIKRLGKSGEYAGKEFWGCSKYPACRGVLEI